jgi:hypothetical protein
MRKGVPFGTPFLLIGLALSGIIGYYQGKFGKENALWQDM